MESSTSAKLEIQKEFHVPAERLYEVWTREEDLKKWWHPLGNQLVKVTNDIKKGGQVSYEFNNTHGGHPLIIEGIYQEVVGTEKLAYTWNWKIAEEGLHDTEFLLQVRFVPQGERSRLEVLQENFRDEEAIQPHREGWEKALEDLRTYLENK